MSPPMSTPLAVVFSDAHVAGENDFNSFAAAAAKFCEACGWEMLLSILCAHIITQNKEEHAVSFIPFPNGFYESVLDIRPEDLRRRGITLLLADLDNTLVPYKTPLPTQELKQWKEELAAGGVELFLLSNSRRPGRPKRFADALGIDFIGHAGKPKQGGYQSAMERTGRTAGQTAIVGDRAAGDNRWSGSGGGRAPRLYR